MRLLIQQTLSIRRIVTYRIIHSKTEVSAMREVKVKGFSQKEIAFNLG